MRHKYTSMQEELEARKAAGEFGDLTEFNRRFRREEPTWYRSSMMDAGRTRAKVSEAGDPGSPLRRLRSGSGARQSSAGRSASGSTGSVRPSDRSSARASAQSDFSRVLNSSKELTLTEIFDQISQARNGKKPSAGSPALRPAAGAGSRSAAPAAPSSRTNRQTVRSGGSGN
ncbi:MAG: hypothetical protein IJH77_05220, partial [Mogibacterium sp.]|nr:hypothetical protein [Mogibacterium sp.]